MRNINIHDKKSRLKYLTEEKNSIKTQILIILEIQSLRKESNCTNKRIMFSLSQTLVVSVFFNGFLGDTMTQVALHRGGGTISSGEIYGVVLFFFL
jgi:hypothetical protein